MIDPMSLPWDLIKEIKWSQVIRDQISQHPCKWFLPATLAGVHPTWMLLDDYHADN